MALRTFQANTQEQLADHRCQLFGLPSIAKHCHRAVVEGAALGGDQLTRELIPRLSVEERLTNPAVVVERRLDAHVIRIRTQQIGPFVCPVFSELGLKKQSINQFGSLVWIGIIQKLSHFFRRRNSATNVRGHATKERVIIADGEGTMLSR